MSNEQIGKDIKKARKQIGLRQKDVAEKASISVNYYACIERGEVNPALETLRVIEKILKIKSLEIRPS